jgi:hypothetical protein
MKRFLLLASLFLALPGCKLIDQTTFAPSPEAAPAAPQTAAAPAAPATEARRPLVVIDYGRVTPEYRDLLRLAVHAAQARDPQVQYDVVAIAPTADAAPAMQDHAAEVMRTIMLDHVPEGRIHLGLRVDPSQNVNQVRVYVR